MEVRNHRRGTLRALVSLAPGIRLARDRSMDAHSVADRVLVSMDGNVHLNQHALVILDLCDGSRSRERIVMDAVLRSPGTMRASDVMEFLDAAQARGWLIEGGPG